MSDQIYHDLRERINQYAIGFNETESQVEIKLLKKLFTEESARMYMLMKAELEPVESIAARADMDIEKASALLAEMTQKGLTFPINRDGIQYYAAAPFAHGISENFSFANSESPDYHETAKIINEYMTGGFFPAGPSMRTIPINDGVETDQKKMILPFENGELRGQYI